jgi:ABC-type uncharacterized transport system permease subunit
MRLALGGLFLILAVVALMVWHHTGDFWAAIGAGAFAIASIAYLGSIIVEYEGAKRQ